MYKIHREPIPTIRFKFKHAIALGIASICIGLHGGEPTKNAPGERGSMTSDEIYEELVEADRQTKREDEAIIGLNGKIDSDTYWKIALEGPPTRKKAMELRERLIAIADSGNTRAQYVYGAYLFNYVSNEYSKYDNKTVGFGLAEKYIRKAAAKNYAPAMCVLGTMASTGNGLPKSDLVAIEWHSKAANRSIAIGDRDQALQCLEHIKQIDTSHPYYQRLLRKLYH